MYISRCVPRINGLDGKKIYSYIYIDTYKGVHYKYAWYVLVPSFWARAFLFCRQWALSPSNGKTRVESVVGARASVWRSASDEEPRAKAALWTPTFGCSCKTMMPSEEWGKHVKLSLKRMFVGRPSMIASCNAEARGLAKWSGRATVGPGASEYFTTESKGSGNPAGTTSIWCGALVAPAAPRVACPPRCASMLWGYSRHAIQMNGVGSCELPKLTHKYHDFHTKTAGICMYLPDQLEVSYINGHDSGSDWLEVPTIYLRPIFQA